MKIKKVVIKKQYVNEWEYRYHSYAGNHKQITESGPHRGHYECMRAAKAYAQAFKEVPVIVDKSKAK